MTVRQAGQRGGAARAARLSVKRRREIARKAGQAGARVRWGRRKKSPKTPAKAA